MLINGQQISNEMIEIPKGFIQMRDDRINKVWNETIRPFYISKYPVTNQLYDLVMDLSNEKSMSANYPKESVSWYEAVEFCNRLSELEGLNPYYLFENENKVIKSDTNSKGYRLPSEAEWEYSCRSGSAEYRYGNINEIAWYFNNSNEMIHEVGQKKPNKWGLYDMIGNVWEWCDDLYDKEVYGEYRIFRGGGWYDYERSCGASCRRRSHPIANFDDLGFRIAKSK